MQSLPPRQPLTCTQSAGSTSTEPRLKSLAEAASGPTYKTPLITTIVSSLLGECSPLSVPAGILRICVKGPVLGSPERAANCVPFTWDNSTHFKSMNEIIVGVLLSLVPTSATTEGRKSATAAATKNIFISNLYSLYTRIKYCPRFLELEQATGVEAYHSRL